MAISIQKLFNATCDLYRLKLISGKTGGNRPVSWVYYTEDVTTLNFLRGGELVVTTAMSIERNKSNSESEDPDFAVEYLCSLVKELVKQNASGLILNVGKYLNLIPQKVMELCDELNFPLIVMPWEIHIIDIMQDYGNRILGDRQKGQSIEQTLYNAMFQPENFDENVLKNTQFYKAGAYSVILIEIPDSLKKMNEDDRFRYINYFFNAKLSLHSSDYCCFFYEGRFVYVFHENAHEAAGRIEKVLKLDKQFAGMKLSVSGVCSEIEGIAAEYRHADLALRFARSSDIFCDYESLGIYKLLGEVQDKKVLEAFYQNVLGQLEEFGTEKLNDYLNTLKIYLSSGGKVAKAAAENSTHRNTVNYRIKRICDTLNIDLNDGETRYMIQTALCIKEMLEKM